MTTTTDPKETVISMSSDDRSLWYAASDDPVMQRKLEGVGAVIVKTLGATKFYRLDGDKILFRAGKKKVSEQQKERARERMKALRASAK